MKENIAAKALARYAELCRLAEQSFRGPAIPCDGGEDCQYKGHKEIACRPHSHHPYRRGYSEADLQERIRTFAVITEEVSAAEAFGETPQEHSPMEGRDPAEPVSGDEA